MPLGGRVRERRNIAMEGITWTFPLRSWGEGLVHRVEGDAVTVLFEQEGYKTLSSVDTFRQRSMSTGGDGGST